MLTLIVKVSFLLLLSVEYLNANPTFQTPSNSTIPLQSCQNPCGGMMAPGERVPLHNLCNDSRQLHVAGGMEPEYITCDGMTGKIMGIEGTRFRIGLRGPDYCFLVEGKRFPAGIPAPGVVVRPSGYPGKLISLAVGANGSNHCEPNMQGATSIANTNTNTNINPSNPFSIQTK